MLPLHLAFRNITVNGNTNYIKDITTNSRNSRNSTKSTKTSGPTSKSDNNNSLATAVNWLVVEEPLTAHPVAIFSRDRKEIIPPQGGLFAAKEALKDCKKETTSNNHHKPAVLKVLEL
jgi:hypothetical protein